MNEDFLRKIAKQEEEIKTLRIMLQNRDDYIAKLRLKLTYSSSDLKKERNNKLGKG
jgi:uncharacterized coiled-coil protein SlyX